MMKITIFALAALALVLAQDEPAAQPTQPAVQILKQDSEVDVDKYSFEFETSDGTSRQEQGDYKNDTDQQGLSVKGSYKYVAPDGQHIAVTYIADKNGYQPTEEKDDQKPAASESVPSTASESVPSIASESVPTTTAEE